MAYVFAPEFRHGRACLILVSAGSISLRSMRLVKSGLDLLRLSFPTAITLPLVNHWLSQLSHSTLLGFLGFYIWLMFKGYTKGHYTELNVVEAVGWATLTLLLFATPWLMPWYASIVLTIAALIPQSHRFGITSLAFGLSSSAQYLLQGNESLKSIVAIGLPTLVLAVGSRFQPRSLPVAERATAQP